MQICQEKPVELVITDLSMPDMDGIELIRSLRNPYPDLPILAMSGTFTGQFFKVAKRLGAVETLGKPFRKADLLEMVIRSWKLPSSDLEPAGQLTGNASRASG